jgi:hypothetical protein
VLHNPILLDAATLASSFKTTFLDEVHKATASSKLLFLPTKHWHDVLLDLFFGLQPSSGFDLILVVKDRLSKRAHYMVVSDHHQCTCYH